MNTLHCGRFLLNLDRPLIMGIVNLTPDSFSGDGLLDDLDQAIRHARYQLDSGAAILDIGAESTRPGAQPASEQEELARLLPLLEEIRNWPVPISVDTYKPSVMRAVLKVGASMINDISGMTNPAALEAVASSSCAVCVMHMQGEPGWMQRAPSYDDVYAEVRTFLAAAITRCRSSGVALNRLVVDPGFCFGKTLQHNLSLFSRLAALSAEQPPVLVGMSRKSMLGTITGQPVERRLVASVAAAMLAAQKGAKILRVHDVAETRDALAVWSALENGEK